jgi:hypothetical protein
MIAVRARSHVQELPRLEHGHEMPLKGRPYVL